MGRGFRFQCRPDRQTDCHNCARPTLMKFQIRPKGLETGQHLMVTFPRDRAWQRLKAASGPPLGAIGEFVVIVGQAIHDPRRLPVGIGAQSHSRGGNQRRQDNH
jgi:hypothetical protein